MAARILALLAAVAMVVGAVVARERLNDREERTSTTLRLVCSTELEAVCAALATAPGTKVETKVEPAATTAGTLTNLGRSARLPLDGWLVPGPWPAMVADARERTGLDQVLSSGPVLARSPVVLAVWPDRAKALATPCGAGGPGWKCLGDVAGQPWEPLGGQPTWGKVKPGHPPLSTGTGLAVLGAATVAYFGGRGDLSSADLADDGYRDWLTRLQRSMPPVSGSPLEAMVVRGPSAFDAVGTIEAEAGPLLARTARADKPMLLYPSPVATADVVLGSAGGKAAVLLAELVSGPEGRRALAGSGWRVAGQARARGVPAKPPLPADSGLPSPGLLIALRQTMAGIRT